MSFEVENSGFDWQVSRFTLHQVCAICLAGLVVLGGSGCDDKTGGGGATAAASPPQAELRAQFDASPRIVFEAPTASAFSQFRPGQQAQLTVEGDRLKVTASGADPQMFLPAFVQGKRFIMEVTLNSPVATLMQAFYLRKGQTSYTEGQSQQATLSSGMNVVYFRFDAPDVVDPLRLDVGAATGDYVIEKVVAREIATY